MKQLTISGTKQDFIQTNLVEPIFARHETFHLRFGWLKKGFDLVAKDSGIFQSEDAPIRLGVGKNMVRSIRYWCKTFKVLGEDRSSEFGHQLFADGGWDSFLEDPASLWLLHWNLLKPTCKAAAWYFTFFEFKKVEFTTDELLHELNEWQHTFKKQVVESSLKKDISCILRMYGSEERNTSFLEDSIDSPFQQLGLIQNLGGKYSFKTGAKANLPAAIVVAACLEYASWMSGTAKTIAISRLVYDSGSPGMAFKLSENVLCEAIEKVVRSHNELDLSDTAGLIQFSFKSDPKQLAEDILNEYYQFRRTGE
ncbi:hypothetical protein Xen7305DRAFT_00015480 [Xenococcus sp. PCC 7305]|uniref:DUF4007 family protein n=1 Tax=Xenococcus sp. PCC 7305 TaxID=102125 RepID=UPI0002AC3413|nr:DUF4007 family protein [Xenococcus sp. PCC 7305]ELS01841.1 hypothetical protein Xen7305DRAFT_00015480 [Xenococcus sp. PCC 7305]